MGWVELLRESRCWKGSLEELGEKPHTINTTRKRCLLFVNGLIIHSWRLGLKKQRLKSKVESIIETGIEKWKWRYKKGKYQYQWSPGRFLGWCRVHSSFRVRSRWLLRSTSDRVAPTTVWRGESVCCEAVVPLGWVAKSRERVWGA